MALLMDSAYERDATQRNWPSNFGFVCRSCRPIRSASSLDTGQGNAIGAATRSSGCFRGLKAWRRVFTPL